jgi:hypothetical protein
MILVYALEQILTRAIELGAWTFISYAALRHNPQDPRIRTFAWCIGIILVLAYLGKFGGGFDREDALWTGVVLGLGVCVGALLARRANRRSS